MNTLQQQPYWLGGTERCHVCEASYVLQMEYRCVGCDQGMCDRCIVLVWETHTVYCPGCHAELELG